MTTDDLKAQVISLIHPETKEEIAAAFAMYKEVLFQFLYKHQNTEESTLSEINARLVIQMMFSKLAHLEESSHGISFTSSDGHVLNNITDPILISSSVRAFFETVGMFHVIWVSPQTKEEKLILHSLWAVAGLNYRQKFVKPSLELDPDKSEAAKKIRRINIAKGEEEKKFLEDLIAGIKSTELYQNQPVGGKVAIDNAIKNKVYYILFKDGVANSLPGFQGLMNNTGVESELLGQLYTYFSLSAHPSYVSVFQFSGLFEVDSDNNFNHVQHNLFSAFRMIAIFIADYIKVFPEVMETFKNFGIVERSVIYHINRELRGEDYDIF